MRPEDPAATAIEEVLRTAAAGSAAVERDARGRVVTGDAAWFCACETRGEWETWVVHAVGDEGIAWLRFADAREADDVLVADRLVAHHPAPGTLLRWLRGPDPDLWRCPDDDPRTAGVVAELHRRVRSVSA